MSPMPNALDQWTVLIVDDHFDNVQVARTVLEYFGAEVAVADDGQQALNEAAVVDPTVILMDLSMPNMNGYEALKHLRANPRYDAVPIVAVTAHAMPYDRDRALAAGFDGYLSKPYDVTGLVRYLVEIVSDKRGSSTQ